MWLGQFIVCNTDVNVLNFRIERSYDDDEEETADAKNGAGKSGESSSQDDEKIPDSTLSPEIQTLCRLIFNSS